MTPLIFPHYGGPDTIFIFWPHIYAMRLKCDHFGIRCWEEGSKNHNLAISYYDVDDVDDDMMCRNWLMVVVA